MPEESKTQSSQKDATKAAEERPVPSQAEGDRDTVEEDLAQKERANSTTSGSR